MADGYTKVFFPPARQKMDGRIVVFDDRWADASYYWYPEVRFWEPYDESNINQIPLEILKFIVYHCGSTGPTNYDPKVVGCSIDRWPLDETARKSTSLLAGNTDLARSLDDDGQIVFRKQHLTDQTFFLKEMEGYVLEPGFCYALGTFHQFNNPIDDGGGTDYTIQSNDDKAGFWSEVVSAVAGGLYAFHIQGLLRPDLSKEV